MLGGLSGGASEEGDNGGSGRIDAAKEENPFRPMSALSAASVFVCR